MQVMFSDIVESSVISDRWWWV